MLSLLKHFNKGNFADGLKYFASQQAYSVVLRSTVLLATNTRNVVTSEGVQRDVTSLVQHAESTTLVPMSGDTNKAKMLCNQVVSKALHFYKIIWQYLWLHKPEDVFSGENTFIVDAHFFFPQLFDTLTYLPHV